MVRLRRRRKVGNQMVCSRSGWLYSTVTTHLAVPLYPTVTRTPDSRACALPPRSAPGLRPNISSSARHREFSGAMFGRRDCVLARALKACRGDRTSGEVDFPNVPAATRVILAVYHVLESRFALNNEEAGPARWTSKFCHAKNLAS
jgi:hypothetical protein